MKCIPFKKAVGLEHTLERFFFKTVSFFFFFFFFSLMALQPLVYVKIPDVPYEREEYWKSSWISVFLE